ncbi:unnamed protein product [Symbiodinium sp. KB8]|nr:unnamed protein product [Symbiodinium sp. KB8]
MAISKVGIIALNVIGTPLNRGSAPHEASPFGSGGNYLSDMALDMKTDPETANALREVFRAKADAAEKEDFDRVRDRAWAGRVKGREE